MKVYIVSDMEGATGVTHGEQTHAGGKDYERARKWLTGDVNAAVAGAFEGGADYVRVSDGHGTMRNVLLEDLDERVELVAGMGLERDLCQLETIDDGFDLLLAVGYHAKVGTVEGILSHTWIGGIVREFRMGGRVVGETGISAMTAGSFGTPLAMVAGDEALCREALDLLGDVETAAVKKGLGNRLALCKPPAATSKLIREAARRAVEGAARFKPFKVASPVEVVIRLPSGNLARQVAKSGGAELFEGDALRIVRPTVREAAAAAWRACYMATIEQGAYANW